MPRHIPLSARVAGREVRGPYEEIPEHLSGPLADWLMAQFRSQNLWRRDLMRDIALGVEIVIAHRSDGYSTAREIVAQCERDDETFLDVLDATLSLTAWPGVNIAALRDLLEKGGSVWTVTPDGKSLERRVDQNTAALLAAATAPSDAASDELAEAWAKIYGRNPDPSDAWDHAIKAVETVLAPLVIPGNPKATLGAMISALEAKPSKWEFVLAGDLGSVEAFTEMCRLIWPNPDRHGGNASRPPTLAEATAAVQQAVLLVQLCRDGALS